MVTHNERQGGMEQAKKGSKNWLALSEVMPNARQKRVGVCNQLVYSVEEIGANHLGFLLWLS
jgi:hypothetical protein